MYAIGMSLIQAIILGIVQGITEFLPISSSGHLVLGEVWLGLDVADLKDFDVAVHVASLLAILLYFWRDLIKPKYWPWLILGTIPAVIVGFTLEDQIDAIFRSVLSVGIVMMVMGAIFCIPEKFGQRPGKLGWLNVIAIGLAQALAIIPGVSRSGSTIFTAKMLGLGREEAARFSFMLGSIAIAGAGLLTVLDLEELAVSSPVLGAGFAASFIASFAAIWWLMRFLKNHSIRVFGIYLLILGATVMLLQLV